MTNRTNKLVKRLLYDEQKQWHNKNNWSIFQNALVSKGVTTYKYPTNATAGLDEKITFLDNIKEPWQKIGQDIDGEAVGDQSGYSVSLSADGTIVAIGAINNDGSGSNSGHVRVYEFKEGSWQQLGGDIDGEAVGDQSGWSVSLSADGSVVAIGAINNHGNDGNESYLGHVRVYEFKEGSWNQKGTDIDGEAAVDQSGFSVSLSADGTIVAISSTGNDGFDGTNSWRGHVRVYEFKEGSWNQKGADIDGEAQGDESGWSVSISMGKRKEMRVDGRSL
jgi:hypothetical protein